MLVILSLMLGMLLMNPARSESYADREDVRAFAEELAGSDGFTTEGLLTVFRQARYKQSIIDAISRPAEKTLTWGEYRRIFLTRARITAGREFMVQNQEALAAAHSKYGIPPVIVTAILGVETMYGKRSGSYRVLDALTTLAFDYPPRASFFRNELKEFLRLVREENQVIVELQGSYAGAMGYGQFIPSSYRHYAVDFDGDGERDIWSNPVDAIGSVANYFAEHGWRPGESVVCKAYIETGRPGGDIFNVSLAPSSTVGDLRKMGVFTDAGIEHSERVSPMKLVGDSGTEYWLGLHNFYVITRYNHSRLYAMAVYQLSEALRTSMEIASQT